MQRKTTKKALARASVPLPEGAQAIVEQLVQGPMTAEAIEMLSGQLKKALIERALQAELWVITWLMRSPPRRRPTTVTAAAAKRC